MVDDTQPTLFSVPAPIMRKVERKDLGGTAKYTKYRPKNPVKCDDCMLLLFIAKGEGPASRQARWRRVSSTSDLLLCQGHADLRREEDGLPALKGYSG